MLLLALSSPYSNAQTTTSPTPFPTNVPTTTISANLTGDYTCNIPNGGSGTCNLSCESKDEAKDSKINCGDSTECYLYCEEKKCMDKADLYAPNATNLHIIIGAKGEECMKDVNIYAPNNGNVYIQSGDGKKGLKGIKIHSGTNTNDIIINYTASTIYGNEMKEIEIYASSAQTLQINMSSAAYTIEDAIIECPTYPIDSQYDGNLASSCIIDASNGGILKMLKFELPMGFRKAYI